MKDPFMYFDRMHNPVKNEMGSVFAPKKGQHAMHYSHNAVQVVVVWTEYNEADYEHEKFKELE